MHCRRIACLLSSLVLVLCTAGWPGGTRAAAGAVSLPVPFTSQAPYANWGNPYQESCEEASMLMAAQYYLGNTRARLTPSFANRSILRLVAWEKKHRGGYADSTAAEVAEMLGTYFKLSAEVVPYEAAALRQAVAAGNLVLLPAAGRLLPNPHFKHPGPLYHMVVVKGYQGDEFIVNDPGTRYGAGFRYSTAALNAAVHDWNGGDVLQGQQVMVVVNKSGR